MTTQLTQRQAVRAAVRRAPSRPGDRLPNGAIIVAQQYHGDDSDRGEQYHVLALQPGNAAEPYVTWLRVIGIGTLATGGWHDVDYCFHGHYHRQLDAAYADFQQRCASDDTEPACPCPFEWCRGYGR